MIIVDSIIRSLTVSRRRSVLVAFAALIGATYFLATFDLPFIIGRGPFWAFPVGPWLQDSTDTQNSVDVLDFLVGFTGLVNSPWTLPLLFVPAIGAPQGTNVVFLDVIPGVALIGRVVSNVMGVVVLPYGVWVGACFILSPISASLLLAEAGQASLLASASAAVFAVSAPTLLHRFPHLPLMAHFLLIGALWLYCIDKRSLVSWKRLMRWAGWLLMTVLTNPYLLAMVGIIYAASLVRYVAGQGLRSRWLEPMVIAVELIAAMFAVGYLGTGQSFSGEGFGKYSMNLVSPIVPQRSGLFPQWQSIVDATGGQYEGFSYLGVGGIALTASALLINARSLWRWLIRNPELAAALFFLTLYALSTAVFAGSYELLRINIGWKLNRLANIYRSSGRMFWPVYYAVLFGSLLLVLRRLSSRWQVAIVGLCCLLQLLDAEPLRARLTKLTDHGGQPWLDTEILSSRISRAHIVNVFPTFFCSDDHEREVDMEIQLAAIRQKKSFNVAYNPRLHPDCQAEEHAMMAGPWSPDTLYVFLNGSSRLPANWVPPNLACEAFAEGRWCLGNPASRVTRPE